MTYISLEFFHFLTFPCLQNVNVHKVYFKTKMLMGLSRQIKLFPSMYVSFLNSIIVIVNTSECIKIKITFRIRNAFRVKSQN